VAAVVGEADLAESPEFVALHALHGCRHDTGELLTPSMSQCMKPFIGAS
jgi:hypothetical protein